MSVSYVPDVSMFPYWKNKDAGGLVRQVKELQKENSEFVEKYDKIVDENDGLQQDHYRMSKKIKKLVEEKQELEAKVDEAQVIYQENVKYSSEFEAIRRSIEEQCEAAGIMEVMNMRIEDAEKNAREQELLKVIAETQLEKEIKEKKELHNEINNLQDALENADIYKCNECSQYLPSAGIEDCFGEQIDGIPCMVCLECRDEHYTQCDECMDYHHNTNITNIEDREVCTYCNSIP